MESFSEQSLFLLSHYRKFPLEDGSFLLFNSATNGLMKTTDAFVNLINRCSTVFCYKELVNIVRNEHNVTDLGQLNATFDNAIKCGILLHLNSTSECNIPLADDFLSSTETANSSCNIGVPTESINKVSIMITDRCNCDCSYCLNKSTRLSQRHELSFLQWKSVVDQLILLNCSSITFTGGEPLLSSTLFEIAQYCKINGINTAIISNGILFSDDNIQQIADCFDSISISIDSHIQAIADRLRGKGTYQSAIAAISLLKKVKKECVVNSVMTGINIDYLTTMYDYFYNTYDNVADINPMVQEYDSLCPEFSISTEQLLKFVSNNMDYHINKYGYEALIKSKKFPLAPKCGCGVGSSEIAISPDGKVYPCRVLYTKELECGDILSSSIREIYNNSEILKKIRYADTHRPDKCKNGDCGLSSFCRGGCFASTYYASGSYTPVLSPRQCAFQHKYTAEQIGTKSAQ